MSHDKDDRPRIGMLETLDIVDELEREIHDAIAMKRDARSIRILLTARSEIIRLREQLRLANLDCANLEAEINQIYIDNQYL